MNKDTIEQLNKDSVLCYKLGKLKYTEEGIKEEAKTHTEGACFSRGYNLGIEDAQNLAVGGENSWIDSPENPHNKKEDNEN